MNTESASVFHHRRRVAFSETDLSGGLHFAQLLRYFEEAEQALFRHLQIPMLWQSDDGLSHGWPRVSAECDLLAPIPLAAELEIAVQVERIRHTSVRLVFEVFHQSQLVARGALRLACIAASPGQPMRAAAIPEEFAGRLKNFAASTEVK
ncbi:acyl-CoA thioesterase [Anatilimnocola floriformis]|uniref:acyl-CoA thioesterase n=1 Tax=Anatilimnocola floriformis TaxID=2948575 RepID=UPI0020C38C22|nr:thioesterase family protein [Anatilimnocola floriformis]